MEGVSFPVLGVSDTGDTKMMYPNGEYHYNGNSVTEYPMNSLARGGHLFQGRGSSTLTTGSGDERGFEAAKMELQRRIQEANERAGFAFQPPPDQHKTAVTFNKDYNEYMPLINLPEVVINGGKRNAKFDDYHDAHAANVAKAQQTVQEWDDRDQLVLNTMMGIGMSPLVAVNPAAFALGAAGGEAVNAGMRALTDYEGFGDMMSNTIHGNSDYAGLYDWANPGYLIGGKGARLDNRLFGRTPTLGTHTAVRTNDFGEPVSTGFQIGKPRSGALTTEQRSAFDATIEALNKGGIKTEILNDTEAYAINTNAGIVTSGSEYGKIASALDGNRPAVGKTKMVETENYYYLCKGVKGHDFEVIGAFPKEQAYGLSEREVHDILEYGATRQSKSVGRNQRKDTGNVGREARGDVDTGTSTAGSETWQQAYLDRGIYNAGGNRLERGKTAETLNKAFKTSDGTVYGFNKDGKIYLTPEGLNPETPIHEYSEIWGHAMRQNNPKGWESAKKILQTEKADLWREVLGDENYARLVSDDDIAIEVLGRFSGKRGAERMQELAKTSKGRQLLQNIQEFLNKVWQFVGKDLFKIKDFKNSEEIADRVLYDLTSGTNLGKVKSDVGFNRLSLNEINHELSTESITQSMLPEQFREVRHYYPKRDIFVPKDFKGSEYIQDDGFSNLPSLESEYVFDNYAKAMGRRRSYLWMNMPYFYDDYGFDAMRLGYSNSFLIGQQSHPDGIFHPTHFAPENLRDGYRLIEQASNAETPTLFTVTDDLSPMLYKLGFKRLGQMPQIFDGKVVTKDVMGNSKVNKAAILSEIERQYLSGKIDRNQYDNLISLIKGYDFAHGGHLFQGGGGSTDYQEKRKFCVFFSQPTSGSFRIYCCCRKFFG